MAKVLVFAAIVLLHVLHLHAFQRFAPGERQPQLPGQNGQADRGSWGVSVNKDKGRGPQIRTEGQGNIWTSRDGNWRVDGHGHHEAGKGRKPSYGGGVEVNGRWRREAEDQQAQELQESLEDIQITRQKRSPQRDRGSIGVTVNKDQGRGPQVRTDARGNIYTSPNGRFNVDGYGHHEFGKGRKPDYGGGVQAGGNIYRSRNGNWNVDGTGNLDVNRGQKPDYGAGVRVTGRFRREINDNAFGDDVEAVIMDEEDCDHHRERRFTQQAGQSGDRGSWGVSVNKDKGSGPQVRTEGKGNVYSSPNGNVKVDAHGHHEFGKGRKPSYGGGVSVHGRWRRETPAEVVEEFPDEEVRMKRSTAGQSGDRGSWGVSVNKDKGSGPQVRTEGKGNVYSSPNGNVKVDAHGHHEFGKGRKPSYGGGVSVHGRWRRETPAEVVEEFPDEEVRMKRSANPGDNSLSVQASHDRNGGPHIRTEAERNFFRSQNGNFEVNGHAFHEAGRGMKPNYGGGVRFTGRW